LPQAGLPAVEENKPIKKDWFIPVEEVPNDTLFQSKIEPEKPINSNGLLCNSTYSSTAIGASSRTALKLLLSTVLYDYFTIKNPAFLITGSIIFVVVVFYFQFIVQNRFKKWGFFGDYFVLHNLYGLNRKKFLYSAVTAYQVRERFGSQSGNEGIPNYTEMAIWINHTINISFDEIDYENYAGMEIFFTQKMESIGLEMAPYRE